MTEFFWVDLHTPRASALLAGIVYTYARSPDVRTKECPEKKGHARKEGFTRPLKVSWIGTRNLLDFTQVFAVPVVLITDRVRAAFTEAGFAGFRYFPIECVEHRPDLDGVPPDEAEPQAFAPEELQGKMWELSTSLEVKFKSECGLQRRVVCDGCGLTELTPRSGKPLSLDLSAWHGEDVVRFVTGELFVTQRVVDLVAREGFSGIEFIPLENYGKRPDPLGDLVRELKAKKDARNH